MTTRTSCGTAATKRSSASASTTVPVGLLGLHTNTRRVRGVIAARIASRSCPWPASSGTATGVAPAIRTSEGYASKDRHAKTTSSPSPATAWMSWAAISTDPAPTVTWAGSTAYRAASASRTAEALMSG